VIKISEDHVFEINSGEDILVFFMTLIEMLPGLIRPLLQHTRNTGDVINIDPRILYLLDATNNYLRLLFQNPDDNQVWIDMFQVALSKLRDSDLRLLDTLFGSIKRKSNLKLVRLYSELRWNIYDKIALLISQEIKTRSTLTEEKMAKRNLLYDNLQLQHQDKRQKIGVLFIKIDSEDDKISDFRSLIDELLNLDTDATREAVLDALIAINQELENLYETNITKYNKLILIIKTIMLRLDFKQLCYFQERLKEIPESVVHIQDLISDLKDLLELYCIRDVIFLTKQLCYFQESIEEISESVVCIQDLIPDLKNLLKSRCINDIAFLLIELNADRIRLHDALEKLLQNMAQDPNGILQDIAQDPNVIDLNSLELQFEELTNDDDNLSCLQKIRFGFPYELYACFSVIKNELESYNAKTQSVKSKKNKYNIGMMSCALIFFGGIFAAIFGGPIGAPVGSLGIVISAVTYIIIRVNREKNCDDNHRNLNLAFRQEIKQLAQGLHEILPLEDQIKAQDLHEILPTRERISSQNFSRLPACERISSQNSSSDEFELSDGSESNLELRGF